MFDDTALDKRRAKQRAVTAECRVRLLGAVALLFEAAGFEESSDDDRIATYTKFLVSPWQVQILMDESAADGRYETLDPTEPIWWVTASPDDVYEHALAVSLGFSVSRLHAMDALRVAEEVAELITFMLTVSDPSSDSTH